MNSPLRPRKTAYDTNATRVGRPQYFDQRDSLELEHSAFAGSKPSIEEVLDEISVIRFVDKDETLYWIGDEPDGLWRVDSGCLSYSVAPNERGPTLFNTLKSGAYFGSSELFDRTAREATVTARTKSQVTLYPMRSLSRLATSNPEIWRFLGRLTSESARMFMTAADDLLIRSCRARLIAVMLRLAGARHETSVASNTSQLEVTQEELAVMANLSRSVVAQLLASFRKDGLVASGYGHIKLLDLRRMRSALDD